MAQPSSRLQEPVNTKLDKGWYADLFGGCRDVDDSLTYSLRSALKEFFDPLKTNDPRTDFYNMYRRESEEFDLEYARPYEDLNTLLIFVRGSIFPPGTYC